ncbi:hypothetical protein D3C72_1639550 [compost metagenome]
MRIVKDAQTIGIQLCHAFQREGEAFRRLFRQAVDQIDIGRGKTDFARVVQQRKNKFLILLAIDQALNLFVKVLHAHAQAIKALGSQVIEYIQLDFTRIDFNRDFSIGLKTEVGPQKIHQTADLRFIEIGWRTAAPVELAYVSPGKQRRTVQDFLLEGVQILIGFVLLAGDDFIAPAEIAELVAERNVNIERQRAFRISRNCLQKIGLAEGFSKLQRGRV